MLRAMMKSRAQGANRLHRPQRANTPIGSSLRRSGPVRHHRRALESSLFGGSLLRCRGGYLEWALVVPDCPDDPGQLVGERDRGLVMPPHPLTIERPVA